MKINPSTTFTVRELLTAMQDTGGITKGEMLHKAEEAAARHDKDCGKEHDHEEFLLPLLLLTYAGHMAEAITSAVKLTTPPAGRYKAMSRVLDKDGDVVEHAVYTDSKATANAVLSGLLGNAATDAHPESVVSESVALFDTAEDKLLAASDLRKEP